jgi:hypothetical protein
VPALGVQGFDATDLALGSYGKLLIREAGGPRNFPETDCTTEDACRRPGSRDKAAMAPFL